MNNSLRFAVSRGYLLAVAVTAAAAVVRWALAGVLGAQAPYFVFVLAVLIAARYGGTRPGLLATALGAAVGSFLFVSPLYTLWDKDYAGSTTVGLFILLGIGASWICGGLHAANRRIEEKQRQLEHQMRLRRDAEEQIRSVVDHVLDGIITIDESGIVASFNSAAEMLFGYAGDEVIGRNVKVLMPEPYCGEDDGYIINYLRTGMGKFIGAGREVVGRRKDGSVFPMDLAVSDFRFSEKRYFTGIVRDITERKRSEEVLRDADRRKDVFLATLSHELRNPLAPIRSATQILSATCPSDSDSQWCRDVIERQVNQMARLLDDLLDVSRISRNRLELRMKPLDLATVLDAAIETSRPSIEAGRHAFAVIRAPEPLQLEADAIRLTQVFANLLNNAAKYTDPGGKIRLAVEREGSDAVVSIKNTGIGIAPEVLPHVFEMFSQATAALGRSQGGLGIGLALSRSLVELHGGRIEVQSDGKDQGSEFIVRLPLAVAAPARGGTSKPVGSDSGELMKSTPRRILVADDSEDNVRCLAMLLRLHGHEVHVAYDGQQAIEAAETVRPEVALLDIGMPKKNGYEAAQHIRKQPWGKDVVLIAVTGWGQDDDRQRTRDAGFDHHLVKPVQPATLMLLLSELQPTTA